MEDNEIDEFIKFMEEDGIIEWVGMDGSGERTFVFNIDKLAESFPELYDAMMQELNEELVVLYKLGFVEVEYDENLNPGFKITQDGKQYLIDNGIPIPEDWE
jgi:hypothetical protein